MTDIKMPRLQEKGTMLLLVDIQPRLAAAMPEKVSSLLVRNVRTLAALAGELHLPVIVTEQYPQGLGATMDSVKETLGEFKPLEKILFDCCEAPGFMQALETIAPRQIILCGMEAHVCVFQTVLGLLGRGYQVFVAADATSSRKKFNWHNSLENMRQAGAVIASTEMLAFQLVNPSHGDLFKKISALIK